MNIFAIWGTGKFLGLLQTKEYRRWRYLNEKGDFRQGKFGNI